MRESFEIMTKDTTVFSMRLQVLALKSRQPLQNIVSGRFRRYDETQTGSDTSIDSSATLRLCLKGSTGS